MKNFGMDKELITLEYDKILRILSGYAVSARAKEAALETRPLCDLKDAEESLRRTAEAYIALVNHNISPVSDFDDTEGIIGKAALNSVLSCAELLKAARGLRASRLFKNVIEGLKEADLPYLKGLAAGVSVFRGIEDLIFGGILSDDEISDRASAALRAARIKIRNCNRDIKDKLSGFIKSPSYSKYLQDNIITVRGSRFCLSVKAECQGQVNGLVHDRSSSGATLFIEPMLVVELNNQLRILQAEEAAECERILREYTIELGKNAAGIKANQTILIEADILFAKASYAAATKAVCPRLNGKGAIQFKAARHPLIATDKVVPIDVELGKSFSILIITGPNTGGKTVTLKTAGLLCLMASSGLFIPAAEGAEAAVFDKVFCDIGDDQSIAQNLSTFSSHITNIVNITDNAGNRSLVLLDELGAGTDPHEGAALALGIIKYLDETGVKAVITTHYSELKTLAESKGNIQNASMQFDTETLLPTYRLKIGTAGTSCAHLVAKHLGIKEKILRYAAENTDKHKTDYEDALREAEKSALKTDKYLAEIEALKKKLEDEYAKAAAEREGLKFAREKLKENAKTEVKRLAAEAYAKAGDIIAEMKRLLSEPSEAGLFELNRLKNQITQTAVIEDYIKTAEPIKIIPLRPDEMKAGAAVTVISLNSKGIIMSVNEKKNEAEVKMGALTAIVPFSDLGRE